jgi:hypothetical protein
VITRPNNRLLAEVRQWAMGKILKNRANYYYYLLLFYFCKRSNLANSDRENNEIEMKDNFQELNCEEDAINLGNIPEKFFVDVPMFKLGELAKLIKLKLLHIS